MEEAGAAQDMAPPPAASAASEGAPAAAAADDASSAALATLREEIAALKRKNADLTLRVNAGAPGSEDEDEDEANDKVRAACGRAYAGQSGGKTGRGTGPKQCGGGTGHVCLCHCVCGRVLAARREPSPCAPRFPPPFCMARSAMGRYCRPWPQLLVCARRAVTAIALG